MIVVEARPNFMEAGSILGRKRDREIAAPTKVS